MGRARLPRPLKAAFEPTQHHGSFVVTNRSIASSCVTPRAAKASSRAAPPPPPAPARSLHDAPRAPNNVDPTARGSFAGGGRWRPLPHAGFPSPVRAFLKSSLRCPNTLWTSKNDGPNKLWTTAKNDDDVHFGYFGC